MSIESKKVPVNNIFILKYLKSLIWSAQLFFLGVATKKNRLLIYQIYNVFFSFYNPPVKKLLPEISIDSLVSVKEPVTVLEPVVVQGNVTPYETIVLNLIVASKKPKTLFEIGTFDGRTTLNLALNTSENVIIYTIDLPKEETNTAELPVARSDQNLINTNVTGMRFLTENAKILLGNRTITQLYGDTAKFDFEPYYSSCDFVFVDAAHTYEYVKNDSEIALKLLKNGSGVILWHDYDDKHSGSVQAVNELFEANPTWNMFHVKGTNIAGVFLSK